MSLYVHLFYILQNDHLIFSPILGGQFHLAHVQSFITCISDERMSQQLPIEHLALRLSIKWHVVYPLSVMFYLSNPLKVVIQ